MSVGVFFTSKFASKLWAPTLENSGAMLKIINPHSHHASTPDISHSNQRDIMTTYSCNVCHQDFTTKNTRDTHRKSTCVFSIIVRNQNGEEEMIQKVDGKFNCICGRAFTRTDHFCSHWKECQAQGKIYFNGWLIYM